ncbi:hypothetical protein [Dokdonella sp.]|uniref:hypothetical protein n=1 Tax=Dokdonella sp. TaxID=2291710 RepID=UPI001B11F30B|nr:hypothetical protein [Dokdonella sp.]MBO9664339.1 hypothetical protein [Dokdonella sp.]
MRVFVSCAILLAFAGTATAQNLLVNGEFDSDLSGWLIDAAASPAPVWEGFDVDDPARSGAVRVGNASPEAMNRLYPLEQCIALTAPGPYRIVARGYIPPGQGAGKLVVSYWLSLDNPDCPQWQGSQSGGGNYITTIGGWGRYEQSITATMPSPIPPNARIKISLGVEKDAAGGEFFGYFDAISVFGDAVFADGFDTP